MKRLFVWVRGADAQCRIAGEIATSEPLSGGRFESEFEYAPEWLRDPRAFPLDPASLPLDANGRRFRAHQFHPPLAVFEDALPDDWGRRLLTAALKVEGRKPSLPEMLLYLRGGGTGALLFTETPVPPELASSVQTRSLRKLLDAARKFEAGTLGRDDDFRRLLEGSSRAGGARPKALVQDDEGEWLAKFPSRARDESHDVVGLEATCLELARHAGLPVPESRLQTVGRRRVLLVRRFDVTPQGGRVHMLSLRTICKERPGVFVTGYGEVAEAIRKYSAAPSGDLAMFFRHMVFNAAIGNVDDHLKNFWMLATPGGYRLAPAFDLVPDVTGRSEHTLSFRYEFSCPTREVLIAIGDAWDVSQPADIIRQVGKAVAGFANVARRFAVRDARRLASVLADVEARLEMIMR